MDKRVWENSKGHLYVIGERCKGCGFCINLCPKSVLRQDEGMNRKGYHPPELFNPEGCIMCDICTEICPDFAIYRVRCGADKEIPLKSPEKISVNIVKGIFE